MSAPVPDAIVMFATADWRERFWTNKQHIARRLADRGARVLYIESTGLRRPGANSRDIGRIASRLWRAWRSPERVDDRLWVHAPLTIPAAHRHVAIRRLNGTLLRSAISRWLRQQAVGRPVIWTYHPYIEEAIAGIDRGSLVYHCVDDIAAMPGIDSAAFAEAEARLLARADMVFATSPALRDHCARIAGERVAYERNVADIGHFARAREPGPVPAELEPLARPRLVYVGVLSAFKLDLTLIEACVLARPDWSWVFIGDEPERQRDPAIAGLAAQPNVRFLGYRPYAEIPDYLRGIDVAVLPNLTDGYMASVFPMKLYEYFAAGKPVVATPLPALADVEGPLSRASTVAEWIEAVERAFAAPLPLALDDPALARFTWDARLDRMLLRLAAARG